MSYVIGSQDTRYDYNLISGVVYGSEDEAYSHLEGDDISFYEVYDLELLYAGDMDEWEYILEYTEKHLGGVVELHVNADSDIYGVKVFFDVAGNDIIYETVSGSLLEVTWSDDVEYIGLYEKVYFENGELYDESGEHIQV